MKSVSIALVSYATCSAFTPSFKNALPIRNYPTSVSRGDSIDRTIVLHYANDHDCISPHATMKFEMEQRPFDNAGTAVDSNPAACRSQLPRTKFDKSWNERYEQLQEFYRVHGHSDVPYSYSDKTLTRWVTNQRQNRKLSRSSMTDERIAKLDAMDFTWETRSTWEHRFQQLQDYYNHHGDCNVPNTDEYQDLRKFIFAQRHQYKVRQLNGTGSMTDERIKALESVDFDFTPHREHVEQKEWDHAYNELKCFYEEYSHSVVPKKNRLLWNWTEIQREEYQKYLQGQDSSMTDERIRNLNALKFFWDADDAEWMNRFIELEEFKELQHGCLQVECISNLELQSWLQEQLLSHSRGQLKKNRYNALVTLGVNFSTRNKPGNASLSWDEQFEQLKEFKSKYGHCYVPQHYKDNPSLGLFVKNQRRQRKLLELGEKSSMTTERKTKLDSIGFAWSAVEDEILTSPVQTLKELSIQNLIKKTQARRRADVKSQRVVEEDVKALMERYKRRSLWGM
mmetsp:Transcript_4423/g.8522  ORF Transcript_4423/g.8522 Transcript_4423/m.8522 type:complete len:510 (+) Transcript_4423:112-1641(+)